MYRYTMVKPIYVVSGMLLMQLAYAAASMPCNLFVGTSCPTSEYNREFCCSLKKFSATTLGISDITDVGYCCDRYEYIAQNPEYQNTIFDPDNDLPPVFSMRTTALIFGCVICCLVLLFFLIAVCRMNGTRLRSVPYAYEGTMAPIAPQSLNDPPPSYMSVSHPIHPSNVVDIPPPSYTESRLLNNSHKS